MSLAEEVKGRLDIVEVISGYVPLAKAGRSFKGLCPFHVEKTPSFFVFPHTQTWHCFGACGTGGDVFTFLMKMENMEFREALRVLAQKAGVPLAAPASKQEPQRLDMLRAINSAAAVYFHHLLKSSPEASHARQHLEARGFAEETLDSFQLGYSLDRWQALHDYLRQKGFEAPHILEAGLIVEREEGGYYDRFRGRLMIPIRDHEGHVVGFSGRALDDSQPKYMNSPQTPLFDKGTILFGLDRAKRAIRLQDQAVIVEGYMDVMMAHQKGRKNVVASMGTAITARHFQSLGRLTKRFVLALDADVAGQQAVQRGLEVAWESLNRHWLPVRSKGRKFQGEYHLGAELRVLTLPEGKDPDNLLREDALEWDRLVDGAPLAMDYLFQETLSGLDLTSSLGKTKAVEALLPLIARIGDGVQRAHYIQELAQAVRVPEKELFRQTQGLSKGLLSERREETVSQVAKDSQGKIGAEEYCLGVLYLRPGLYSESLGLKSEFFSRPENREIFSLLAATLSSGEASPGFPENLHQVLDPPLEEHLDRILKEVDKWLPQSAEEVYADLESRALELAKRYWLRKQLELQFVVDHEANPKERRSYREMGARCSRELNRIAREQYKRTLKGQRDMRGFLEGGMRPW